MDEKSGDLRGRKSKAQKNVQIFVERWVASKEKSREKGKLEIG